MIIKHRKLLHSKFISIDKSIDKIILRTLCINKCVSAILDVVVLVE